MRSFSRCHTVYLNKWQFLGNLVINMWPNCDINLHWINCAARPRTIWSRYYVVPSQIQAKSSYKSNEAAQSGPVVLCDCKRQSQLSRPTRRRPAIGRGTKPEPSVRTQGCDWLLWTAVSNHRNNNNEKVFPQVKNRTFTFHDWIRRWRVTACFSIVILLLCYLHRTCFCVHVFLRARGRCGTMSFVFPHGRFSPPQQHIHARSR